MVCPTMSMKELEMWIQVGRPMVLVDLRSRQEYEAGHLQGAVNIPYEELETRLEEIPRQLPCVLYCSRGSQSLLAAEPAGQERGQRLWRPGGLPGNPSAGRKRGILTGIGAGGSGTG